MMDFGGFYARGGVFMHVVSLLSLVATGMLAARAANLRTLVRPGQGSHRRGGPDDGLMRALVWAALVAGLLGAVLGLMETCAALQTVPAEHTRAALLRAVPIALSPLAWALMLAAPMILGRAGVSALESRLRTLASGSKA